jgi:hypothetical protein
MSAVFSDSVLKEKEKMCGGKVRGENRGFGPGLWAVSGQTSAKPRDASLGLRLIESWLQSFHLVSQSDESKLPCVR